MRKTKKPGERIEEGISESTRSVINIGGSKGVTLPSGWLKIQRWLGKEVSELTVIGNDILVLGPPEKKEELKKLLKQYERGKEKG